MTKENATADLSAEPAVVGNADAVDRLLATPLSRRFADDPVGRELFALLSLHPELPLSFRELNIEEMDEATKRALINDISDLLQL